MTLLRGAGYDDDLGWVVPDDYNVVADVVDWHERSAPAMIWADARGCQRRVAWGELQDLSCQIAHLLLHHGVQQRDVVAVVMPQTVEAAAACIGVLRAGAVLLCLSPLWSDTELFQRLRTVRCSTVLADGPTSARLGGGADTPSVLVPDEQTLRGYEPDHVLADVRADDPAHVYFTSGTTGPPKALVHAQRNLLGHNEFEYCHGLTSDDVFYGAGEWAWSHPKLLGPWRHGAVQFVFRSPRFDPNGLFTALSAAGVSSALVNPTMLRAARAELEPGVEALPWRLRSVCSSNEPLDPELNAWFEGTFGAPVREYYGLTESYPMIGYRTEEPVRQGAAGRPLPGWEVSLHGADGTPVASGEEGEACLRARSNPQYPLGYLVGSSLDATSFEGEWFRTGDTFWCDEDGYWHFVGRNDDVIKTSGYRVGPYELERLLESHPAVAEAGVVGIPDARRGHAVCAFVVRSKQGAPLEPDALVEELQAYVRERHAPFAYPRKVIFVSELPKSSTGKVQRARLRRESENDHGDH